MPSPLNLTNLDSEESTYRSKVESDPKDHRSWFLLGEIYHRKQQFDQAENSYNRALELRTEPEYRLRLGEMYFNQLDYEQALLHLLEVDKQTDKNWKLRKQLDELIKQIYVYDSC